MALLRHAFAVLRKDLRVELRTGEILTTTVFFAVMVVLIFSFAFLEGDTQGAVAVSGGILWIAVAFAGMLGLGRAFEREREGDTMRALLLAPIERGAIFLGKAAGVAMFMCCVEVVVVPLVAILFGAPVLAHPILLLALLVLATIGFAVVGSAFAAMLLRSRMREVLLPVILCPVIVPLLVAGAKGSAALFVTPASLPSAYFWIEFVAVFDAIVVSLSLWAFESLVIE